MSKNAQKIGWIGVGRMGTPMAERLLKAGHDVTIWNRTRAKAEPLAAKAARSSTSRSSSPTATWCSPSSRPARTSSRSLFGKDGVLVRRAKAENAGRLLVDLGRGIRRHPQAR